MLIEITQKDLLRNVVLAPAWYRLRVEEVTEKLAASGTSTNIRIELTTLRNAETGYTEGVEGVPVTIFFNTAAPGFMIGFIEAVLKTKVTAGTRIDIANAKGEEIEAFVEPKLYEGRQTNTINNKFRPAA